jgi:YHS domain-containing protein
MNSQGIETADEGSVTLEDAGKMDPVCGVLVDPDKSDTSSAELGGSAYFFCSDECKQVFLEKPDAFIIPEP